MGKTWFRNSSVSANTHVTLSAPAGEIHLLGNGSIAGSASTIKMFKITTDDNGAAGNLEVDISGYGRKPFIPIGPSGSLNDPSLKGWEGISTFKNSDIRIKNTDSVNRGIVFTGEASTMAAEGIDAIYEQEFSFLAADPVEGFAPTAGKALYMLLGLYGTTSVLQLIDATTKEVLVDPIRTDSRFWMWSDMNVKLQLVRPSSGEVLARAVRYVEGPNLPEYVNRLVVRTEIPAGGAYNLQPPDDGSIWYVDLHNWDIVNSKEMRHNGGPFNMDARPGQFQVSYDSWFQFNNTGSTPLKLFILGEKSQ